MERPGRPGSPLFLDQSEARRVEKILGGDQPPPPLSKGLDKQSPPPPPPGKGNKNFLKKYNSEKYIFPGKWPTQLEDNEVNVLASALPWRLACDWLTWLKRTKLGLGLMTHGKRETGLKT